MKSFILIAVAFCAISAQGKSDSHKDGGKKHPPKEALQACEGKKSGEICSFVGRESETVAGTCFTPESSKPLACKPSHHEGAGK